MKVEGMEGLYNEKDKTYYQQVNTFIVNKLKFPFETALDIGCGAGNLGRVMKDMGAKAYGIEYFQEAAQEAAKYLDHVICGDVLTLDLPYEKEFFDYVVFGDVLEHLITPEVALQKIHPYLKEDGTLIICVPNVAHFSILLEMLQGNWTYEEVGLMDKTHIRFFTLKEMKKLLVSTGYIINSVERIQVGNLSYTPIINELHSLCVKYGIPTDIHQEALAYQYVFEAKKVK